MSKVLMRQQQTSAFIERMDHCYSWFTPNSWTADDIVVNFCNYSVCDIVKQTENHNILGIMPRWMRRDTAIAAIKRGRDITGYNRHFFWLAINCIKY